MINPCNFRSPNRPANKDFLDPIHHPHPTEPSTNPPYTNIEGIAGYSSHPTVNYNIPNPAPTNPDGIILTNMNAMLEDPFTNDEIFNDGDEGMNEDENADMYLNLQNIEDIKMSSDSSKRKRCEDGEEATSQAN